MNDTLHSTLRDALALLVRLRRERVEPEQARELFRDLKARHPEPWMNLVWEREPYDDKPHYDVLIGDDEGTVSLGYCADEALPWPARGLQRVNESLVLRVNGVPVRIGHVVTSLDYAWHTLHLGRYLVDSCLIEEALEEDGELEIEDGELEAALLRFRKRRRLFTVAEVERWLREHGSTQAQLEQHLRADVARERLRRRVAAGREEAFFQLHREELDRVQVARLYVPDRARATRLYERLRETPERLLELAQARFLEEGAPPDVFATLERGALDAEQAARVFSTAPGALAPPVPSGEGYELVRVLRFIPAALDEATRERIADRLFDEWLAARRREARVEWFWGDAEAAELPGAA